MPATGGIVLLPDKHPLPEIPQGDTDSLFQAPRLSSHTRIDVRTLQNGIEASQAARHGRGAVCSVAISRPCWPSTVTGASA
ncbi:hypothetical protein FB570_12422 [Streptomyces sp. T12]|nr:hypothetical protein FB570_12422 [Streptomyces sp. T12]